MILFAFCPALPLHPRTRPHASQRPNAARGSTNPSCMARGRRSARNKPSRSNRFSSRATQRAGEQYLVDQLEEQVQKPLQSRSNNASAKRVDGTLRSLRSFELPGRTQTLNLLVRGAWVGIGVLVGVFVLVHFVIVADFVPK